MLSVTFFACFQLRNAQSDLVITDAHCPTNVTAAEVKTNPGLETCFCQALDEIDLWQTSVCRAYALTWAEMKEVSLAYILAVCVINAALRQLLRRTVRLEAHSTRSREDSVLLRSIFVAITVNTGVLFALANFSPLTGHGYSHFSRGWYDERDRRPLGDRYDRYDRYDRHDRHDRYDR